MTRNVIEFIAGIFSLSFCAVSVTIAMKCLTGPFIASLVGAFAGAFALIFLIIGTTAISDSIISGIKHLRKNDETND